MSLSIILTCYNEVPLVFDTYTTIGALMHGAGIDHEFIIVDDGSRPECASALEDFFGTRPGVRLLIGHKNEGRGMAITRGLRASTREYAGFIDTDLEIEPDALLVLYEAIIARAADMAIGNRCYICRWNINDCTRFLASRTYFLMANTLLSLGALDTETGIKIFRRLRILPVLEHARDKRWFWDTEIVAESLASGLRIILCPVHVRRGAKKSSVHLVRDTLRYVRALYHYYNRRRNQTDMDRLEKPN